MTTEQQQREQVIHDLADMMRHTHVTVEYAVKKKPKGIKVIIEVTQEQMDRMIEKACQKQREEETEQ